MQESDTASCVSICSTATEISHSEKQLQYIEVGSEFLEKSGTSAAASSGFLEKSGTSAAGRITIAVQRQNWPEGLQSDVSAYGTGTFTYASDCDLTAPAARRHSHSLNAKKVPCPPGSGADTPMLALQMLFEAAGCKGKSLRHLLLNLVQGWSAFVFRV